MNVKQLDLITRPDGSTISLGYDAGGRTTNVDAADDTLTDLWQARRATFIRRYRWVVNVRFLAIFVAVFLCVGCERTHQLRFTDVAHLRAREISPVEVVVSGDLGSSGQCVERVVERRHGDKATLIVLLKIADGHCDSHFEHRVDTRGLSVIYLGRHFVLNGPDETGLVWHRQGTSEQVSGARRRWQIRSVNAQSVSQRRAVHQFSERCQGWMRMSIRSILRSVVIATLMFSGAAHGACVNIFTCAIDGRWPIDTSFTPRDGLASMITIRVTPGQSTDLETYLVLRTKVDGSIEADYEVPQGESLWAQIRRHETSVSTPDAMARLLVTKKTVIHDQPALRRLMADFKRIRMRASLSESLTVDGTKLDVVSRTLMNSLTLTSYESAYDRDNELVQWAKQAIRTCDSLVRAARPSN